MTIAATHIIINSGAGYTFGTLVVDRFLHMNNMSHILRAHQLCNAGYQVHRRGDEEGLADMDLLIT